MRAEWDAPGAIPQSALAEWGEFMKSQGITRGLSVMNDDEMLWFSSPGLLGGGALPTYDHVVLTGEGAADKALGVLRAAEEAGEKVVLHCSGGQGRTGLLLGAWLVERHGLTPEAAAEEVAAWAKQSNVNRKGDAGKIRKFLGM
mmetsp:Transcript_32149/g.102387  ORF Transcript_32149/g.102387 Transcript_32149/m.102387 type:complete len:144 (+) Transcript_32149:133-564(+)